MTNKVRIKELEWWKPIVWTLTRDPYWTGPDHHVERFAWAQTYHDKTEAGFKVNYTVSCFVSKICHEAYKTACMWEDSNRQRFVDDWHREVFLPTFGRLRYSFRFVLLPGGYILDYPCTCRLVNEANGEALYLDHNSLELENELQKLPFERDGCRVTGCSVKCESNETLIEENYDMIKLNAIAKSIENSPDYRMSEESLVITHVRRKLELEREFQRVQMDCVHRSKIISVKTRQSGCSVELTWEFENSQSSGRVLRGFRSEDGFIIDNEASCGAHGKCVVETKRNGKSVQQLQAGKEYFYTFFLIWEAPVYAKQDVIDSFFKSPSILRTQVMIDDSLRFSIRVPTQAEITHVERMLEKVKQPPVDANREKLNRALEELVSFVEFDENISKWEKDMIARIESKGYPTEELRGKIDRLQSVIEVLRLRTIPVSE